MDTSTAVVMSRGEIQELQKEKTGLVNGLTAILPLSLLGKGKGLIDIVRPHNTSCKLCRLKNFTWHALRQQRQGETMGLTKLIVSQVLTLNPKALDLSCRF